MNSGTAAYWMPVVMKDIQIKPDRCEGFVKNKPDQLDEWIELGLDLFTDIYGTVVDAYYMIESVRLNSSMNYDFVIDIVMTGMFDSEGDFDECIYEDWPQDIVEQLKVAKEGEDLPNIIGWDYNPILNDPMWEQYN